MAFLIDPNATPKIETTASDPGTICAWMSMSSTANNQAFASRSDSSGDNGWTAYIDTSRKLHFFGKTTGSDKVNVASTSNVNTSTWVHVAIVISRANGGTCRVYVNGVQEATGSVTGDYGSPTGYTTRFGKAHNSFWGGYDGELAEVAQFSAQLDAAQIAGLANGFSPMRVAPNVLTSYVPFIRERIEMWSLSSTMLQPLSNTPQPRVIR